MTPTQARLARLADPVQYAETVTALWLAEAGTRLPYAIMGHEAVDEGGIAAVRDLEMAGLVTRSRVRCAGQVVEVAIRTARHGPTTESP